MGADREAGAAGWRSRAETAEATLAALARTAREYQRGCAPDTCGHWFLGRLADQIEAATGTGSEPTQERSDEKEAERG